MFAKREYFNSLQEFDLQVINIDYQVSNLTLTFPEVKR